jgi:hypothetical protein
MTSSTHKPALHLRTHAQVTDPSIGEFADTDTTTLNHERLQNVNDPDTSARVGVNVASITKQNHNGHRSAFDQTERLLPEWRRATSWPKSSPMGRSQHRQANHAAPKSPRRQV